MISIETTQSFLGEMNDNPTGEGLIGTLAEFVRQEPNVAAFMTMVCSNEAVKNPVTAALVAVAVYEKMRKSQEEAERLKKQMG